MFTIKPHNYKPICIAILMVCLLNLAFNMWMNYKDNLVINPQHFGDHVCVDLSHRTCDGRCECDGLGCDISEGNTQPHHLTDDNVFTNKTGYYDEMRERMREYQISLTDDGVYLYDGDRLVSFTSWTNPKCHILSDLINDND